MPEEVEKVETTPQAEEQPKPTTATVEEKVEMSAEELARKLRNKEEEAARLHKKVEKFEQDEAERKKAAMSETERLQAELAEARKAAQELATKQAQRDAAEKIGLPLVFAERLKGATPEELEADAKKLLESMPKGKVAETKAAAPGAGESATVTDADRRKFLFG